MASRSCARWQFISLWTLGLGAAVMMGVSTEVWGNEAALAAPESASPPPPAASALPASNPTPSSPPPDGQKMEKMPHMRQACAADVKKFCAQVKPGGGRIVECLEEHSKDVSDDCYDLLEKRAQPRKGDTQ
jgi:cysteine rich repeat protein